MLNRIVSLEVKATLKSHAELCSAAIGRCAEEAELEKRRRLFHIPEC